MMPNEYERMPTVLMLSIGDRLAPLKWLDADRQEELAGVSPARAFPIAGDRLLDETDAARLGGAIGTEVRVQGVGFPMYRTGTYAPVTIWGLYARPVGP
jgi:hypothetical protein